MRSETGKIIKKRLKEIGKSQSWLAENMTSKEKPLGLSNNAVSKWISTGKIARKHLQQAADLLEITVDELLAGSPMPDAEIGDDHALERLDAEEKELVYLFRNCVREAKEVLLGSARLAPKIAARSLRRPN